MYPKRDKDNCLIFPDYPMFKPNKTPREIFESGIMGGSYWRQITSGITGKTYKNMHHKYTFLKNIPEDIMSRPLKDTNVKINKYGVKSGATLEYWEQHNWIKPQQVYGWIHWYCDFYSGNRSEDDERQIKRWLGIAGPDGRFRKRLINMIVKKNAKWNDYSISPVIRQLLLQWAYELTKKDFDRYVKK